MSEKLITPGYPIIVCRIDGWFWMFQADYVEAGLYHAVKGSVLCFPESDIADIDDLRPNDAEDVFPVELCRPPGVHEVKVYNKKKTV